MGGLSRRSRIPKRRVALDEGRHFSLAAALSEYCDLSPRIGD
jgi:hypothetical protein